MITRIKLKSALLMTAVACLPSLAGAATITSWDTSNVDVGDPVVADGDNDASVIYQGDPATATSNAQIYYEAPEADTPGLEVQQLGYTAQGESFDGCILATSGTTCDGPFQSGKRFKQQLTDTGPVDLVFNVDPDANGLSDSTEGSVYQVFQRLVNLTGEVIHDVSVELGFGVGDAFQQSADNDGLSFANVGLGPNDLKAFTQYPFGLFGDAENNKNFTLDGFFDNARSGFSLDTSDEDMLVSTGIYGAYAELFGGAWLSQEMAPAGLLWDDDADATTDALVMAWFDEEAGLWEALRTVVDGEAVSSLDDPIYKATLEEFEELWGVSLEEEPLIEDLANLNFNYGIFLSDQFAGDSFTLRVTTTTAPIPLPASAVFLLGGLGVLGSMRLRKSRKPAA
ncbi:choice-of-anchor F family protein [Roseovarius sp. EGI FJ00037]|uniref:choice-of-anchor F family protein n=1 Tax=Roseovarius salincola TaxID=2978479 RepID=UPI0022A736B0|nr:choice-of-anchor F family protein [Roseovarius sp. EGI FJ00037]MCZ0811617.1 choice-of-anchor F family protein [Roseovarius sp. EGI FJ00037]